MAEWGSFWDQAVAPSMTMSMSFTIAPETEYIIASGQSGEWGATKRLETPLKFRRLTYFTELSPYGRGICSQKPNGTRLMSMTRKSHYCKALVNILMEIAQ